MRRHHWPNDVCITDWLSVNDLTVINDSTPEISILQLSNFIYHYLSFIFPSLVFRELCIPLLPSTKPCPLLFPKHTLRAGLQAFCPCYNTLRSKVLNLVILMVINQVIFSTYFHKFSVFFYLKLSNLITMPIQILTIMVKCYTNKGFIVERKSLNTMEISEEH